MNENRPIVRSKEDVLRYANATASFLDQATLAQGLLWKTEDHVNFAKSVGLDGVEVWPQGLRLPLLKTGIVGQIIADDLTDEEKRGITSVHQSMRGKQFTLRNMQAMVALPENQASLDQLRKLGTMVGGLPAVFSSDSGEVLQGDEPFIEKRVQVDPDTAIIWNANNPHEYADQAKLRGFDGLVIDTHHIRRPSASGVLNPFKNWNESIPALLKDGNVHEIHVGVGRLDFGNVNPAEINNEMLDLMSGGAKSTELVQMLRLIAESWKGLVVIELRPTPFKEILGKSGQLSDRDLVQIYEEIRKTLREIFKQ